MKRSDSMKAKLLGDTYAVRLDKGEEIFSSLLRFCEENIKVLGQISYLWHLDLNSKKRKRRC